MLAWYVGPIIAGGIFGIFFYIILRKIIGSGLTRRYWRSVGQNLHGLLRGDENRFWSFYGNIIRETLRYAGLNTLGVILALSPLILFMVSIGAALQSSWNRGAPVTVTPPDAGRLITDARETKQPQGVSPPLTLSLKGGFRQPLADGLKNYALCPTGSWMCPALEVFGFTTLLLDPAQLDGQRWIIVRARHDDRNPLWPYLSDPEFLFFLSFSLCSMAVMLRRKTDAALQDTTGFDMSMMDYTLTWIAKGHTRAMRVLGDFESRAISRKTAGLQIEKPVFVTGLARAGTTILLETLASAEGVATHRYRDFPFIMTPVLWNRFISAFSREQAPVERPHKDRIKITLESPEAFEEPIWQYFFPCLHDPRSLHVLTAAYENPSFEKFYRDHIKKILLIRKGSRYLSKGNYNVSRMEYIGGIFPDALFIIPVRHPLWHVESLVRQHKIFEDYAARNPQVPEYLKAVGHYEFGPQRSPICLTPEGGRRIIAAWQKGEDPRGYAIQWAEIYGFVAALLSSNPELAKRVYLIRFEDLCSNPQGELQKILEFAELDRHLSPPMASQKISPPSRPLDLSEDERKACWIEVEKVATMYGYTFNPVETKTFSPAALLAK